MARTVVITGAASGIGKATAALAEAHGWQPIRADLNEGDVKADLATPQGRAAFVDGVTALVGDRLDAVIVCAGVALPTPLIVKVNYFGAVATLEGLRPLLAQGNLPHAVGISSFASIMQADSELVEACLSGDEAAALRIAESKEPGVFYSSSKAAFARWMRRQAITADWVRTGILLNGIAPGMVVTPMTQAMVDDKTVRAQLEQAMHQPNNSWVEKRGPVSAPQPTLDKELGLQTLIRCTNTLPNLLLRVKLQWGKRVLRCLSQ